MGEVIGKGDEAKELKAWVKLSERFRYELLQDTKFWAFLKGYCQRKMKKSLESQQSVFVGTFKNFLKDLY